MQEKTVDEVRENTRKLATEFIENDDPTGWFEALYAKADGNHELIPWADLEPNRFLREWAESVGLNGEGGTALVVGCGLGDDAKYLDDLGFNVTAFDISPKAIEWAKKIHADTDIKFHTADLFDSPKEWEKAFEFVVEVYTVQALPLSLREKSVDAIGNFVAKNGELVVVQRARENDQEPEGPPWALSPNDLSRFEMNGLIQISRQDYLGDEEEPIKRFVVKYTRNLLGV